MDRLLVNMPIKKVYKQKKYNDKTYVYYTTRAYRNKNGKPTSDAILIGVIDKETQKLKPNDNFFKVYDCDINIKVKGVKDEYK